MEPQSTTDRRDPLDERIDAVVGGMDTVVGEVIERPVKRAVREAIREERATAGSAAPEPDRDAEGENGDGGGRRRIRRFVVLAALVAAAGFLVRRRRGADDPFSGEDIRSTADRDSRSTTGPHDAEGSGADGYRPERNEAGGADDSGMATTSIVGEDDDGSTEHEGDT